MLPGSLTRIDLSMIKMGLNRIAPRAGWKLGEIRIKALRHTYCAARLQTLNGCPVSIYTVSRELGRPRRRRCRGSTPIWARGGTARPWWSTGWSSIGWCLAHGWRHSRKPDFAWAFVTAYVTVLAPSLAGGTRAQR